MDKAGIGVMQALLGRYPGLAGFPHVDLGVRPTPLEEHVIDGLGVLVKRDDLTSPLVGGNKVRALEFLLAKPARSLLTFSTLSAHHAYATGRCGAALGIETAAVIVRRGRRGATLGRLGEACARHVEVDGVVGAVLAAARLWRPGTLVIPPGGASPSGALGYLSAALEFEEVPSRIYLPLGTGATLSGLLAGLMLREARSEVVGVRVADAVAGLRPILWRRARRAIGLLRRHDPAIPTAKRGAVRLRIVKAEGAYGEPTPSASRAVRAARPLRLETTYGGKALAVLLAERRAGSAFLQTCGGHPS